MIAGYHQKTVFRHGVRIFVLGDIMNICRGLLLCLVLVVGWGGSIFAAPVSPDLAKDMVQRQLERLDRSSYIMDDLQTLTDSGGKFLAYLAHLKPVGYVVVAGDDGLSPIVAYSFNNEAPLRPDGDPLRALLGADLSARLKADPTAKRQQGWDAPPSKVRLDQWPAEGTTTTEGWVGVRWGQGYPHNQYCPLDVAGGGARSVAGCPSVAMAQILDYLHAGADVRFTDADDYLHNYGGNRFWFDDDAATYDFPTWPQLNAHLEILQDRWDLGLSTNASGAGALVFACGVAAEQVYNAAVSGTFSVDQALMAYQRFGFSNCELIAPDDPNLQARLTANMQEGKPAHLAVVTPDWQAGHNVVVDGYNSDGFFHVNFGWNGQYDGWYRLPMDLPYNLTVYEGVILDISVAATSVPEHADRFVANAWPNPCNPRAEIGFSLPQACSVRVQVLDARGRLVRTLLTAEQAAGSTTVVWDGCDDAGRSVASGSYLYRVQAGAASFTGKLALVR